MIGIPTVLEIRQHSETIGARGSPTRTWSGKRMLTGTLVSLSGYERMAWDKRTVEATHKFFIRKPPAITITAKDELWNGSQKYKVQYVENPANANRMLVLTLLEQK